MIKQLHEIFIESTGVCTDTRKLKGGNLFFALKGPNFDGNIYAKNALENGAVHAVVDDPNVVVSWEKTKYTLVEDVLQTLQELANHHRKHSKAKVIGITGSNGKTTTKELIAKVLESRYDIIFTKGNLNNHIGVPLTLLTIKPHTEIAIVEMGANHIGEIAELCKMAEPDYGLITNIGQAHLEGFGSIDGVKKGKGELFQSIKNSQGKLFINTDVEYLQELADGYQNVFVYAKNDNFGNKTNLLVEEEYNRLVLSINWKGELINAPLALYGSYNIPNILAALNLGYFFDISPKEGLKALTTYYPNNSRSQKIKTKRNTVYLDAYNANPSSMKHALRAFARIKASKKMVILGDMFELGDESNILHQEIAELSDQLFEEAILVGENFSFSNSKSRKDVSRDKTKEYLQERNLKDYTILLKGSRGMALENLLDVL